MAWTAPRTWVALESETAAIFNTHVRDNLIELRRAPGVKAIRTTTFNLTASTADQVISWDGEAFDTDSMHDNSTNPSRLTIPSGYAGYWDFGVYLDRSSGSGTLRAIKIRRDGSTTEQIWASPGSSAVIGDYFAVRLSVASAGAYFEVLATENAGSTFVGSTNCFFAAFWRGN